VPLLKFPLEKEKKEKEGEVELIGVCRGVTIGF
jgi:hypothetical protein